MRVNRLRQLLIDIHARMAQPLEGGTRRELVGLTKLLARLRLRPTRCAVQP
jgi:hypothetical protein